MVSSEALKTADLPLPVEPADLPEEELRWYTVTLQEVLRRGSRLEASVFDVEGRHAREVLRQCKWPVKRVCGENGLAEAFYPTRFKRIIVQES
ncbi:MAG TPA: restriction endonuclease subunit S, partial [Planctomycetaceae bacterium]|nr:restriction endonuclease subunit S [Planctomycetaceae bacterium]